MAGGTMRRGRMGLAVVLGSGLGWLGVTACAWLLPGTAAGTPTLAPTPAVMADCFWSVQVYAWVDEDGDGAVDEGEPPLEGVQANFSLTFLTGGTTDANGVASVLGMYPSACDPTLDNRLIVKTPAGYEATTPTEVEYDDAREERYEFGFRPLS
jgi:hypothetical protein